MSITTERTIRAALSHPLQRTDFSELGKRYEGKVRDNYTTDDGRRILIVTDRISAFDRNLGTLPLKGQLLNRITGWWFERTKSVAPNHMLSMPDPNVLIARECTPFPVEMVVRAYLAGTTSTSIWMHYEKGAREFCGHQLPDDLRKNQRLPEPILTPSTKAGKGAHDISLSRKQILELTKMSSEDFDRAAEIATTLFAAGSKICAEKGLILVDTKYELGKTQTGEIVVIDEIHTPDSSRFWFEETYEKRMSEGADPESFDKEYVRHYLAERGFRGDGPIPTIPDDIRVEATRRYALAIETLTGEPFVFDLADPIPRIRKNLGLT